AGAGREHQPRADTPPASKNRLPPAKYLVWPPGELPSHLQPQGKAGKLMSVESTPTMSATPAPPVPPAAAKPVRLWPAVVLVALFWVGFFVMARLEKPYFVGFLYALASSGLFALFYLTWWWTRRRIPLAERLYGFILIVGGGVMAAMLSHPSLSG